MSFSLWWKGLNIYSHWKSSATSQPTFLIVPCLFAGLIDFPYCYRGPHHPQTICIWIRFHQASHWCRAKAATKQSGGTTGITFVANDSMPSTTTTCSRSVRNEDIYETIWLSILYLYPYNNLQTSWQWFTESKALEKSSMMASVIRFLSLLVAKSSYK